MPSFGLCGETRDYIGFFVWPRAARRRNSDGTKSAWDNTNHGGNVAPYSSSYWLRLRPRGRVARGQIGSSPTLVYDGSSRFSQAAGIRLCSTVETRCPIRPETLAIGFYAAEFL
jgi:hypothetical protein